MPSLKWRPQAISDLESIEDYYREDAPDYGSFLVQELLDQAHRLEQFPRMGRIVPEIGEPSIRELIHRNYRIIYLVDSDNTEVNVLAVVHSSRQLGDLDSNDE